MNVTSEDIVETIRDVQNPVATVAEVAEFLPIGRRAVLKRLNELHEEGRVDRKDVGARSAVWWVEEPDSEPPAGSVERTDSLERTPDVDDVPEATTGDADVTVGDLDLPGSGTRLAKRQEAVLACYDLLREQGEARRSVFEEEVFPDHQGGYASAYSWWKNCVLGGLKQIAERDDDVEVPDSSGVWMYHR